MPKWGLTAQQRETSPWGLPPDTLRPSKTITDPVHKDIYLTRLERMFLDSWPMQRLRRVRQLGATEEVYPGATHSRLAHCLGTLRVTQNLLDIVLDQRNGPHPKPDLFDEWWSADLGDPDRETFNRWVAEATILARLGALLHDFCHIPYGHSVEDDLRLLDPHDANVSRLEMLWSQLPPALLQQLPTALTTALQVLILSKDLEPSGATTPRDTKALGRYAFVADIVGNTICADLLDYLARDHLFSGLPAKFGTRFLDAFYVTPMSAQYNSGRMAIKIMRGPSLRADVVTELFKLLRFRYELSERILTQHTKIATDAMIGKALAIWYDAIRRDSGDSDSRPGVGSVDARARAELERQLTKRSDDGLLEYLRDRAEEAPDDLLWNGIGSLVNAVLERRIYRHVARSASEYLPMADQVYGSFGSAANRRTVEEECAIYAGLANSWDVLIWVPAPQMRMKAAEVLIDDDHRIIALNRSTYGRRGADIYEAHRALWAIDVYVSQGLTELQEQVVRGWLSTRMGIAWAGSETKAIKPLSQVAAREVAMRRGLTLEQEEQLAQQDLAASTGIATFEQLLARTNDAAPYAVGSSAEKASGAVERAARSARRKRADQPGLDLE